MLLGNLIKSIEPKYKKILIKGISQNSKKVKRGHIFFAIHLIRKRQAFQSNGSSKRFFTVNCRMCPIEEIRYNSFVMNFEKFKKIIGSFGEGINKIRLVN